MAEYTINLETYRAKRSPNIVSKVFTGRDRGVYVREQSKLDSVVREYDTVTIVIPKDIRSINPSFFEELFRNVVTSLGREEFFQKVHFKSEGDYDVTKPLHEAVLRILRDNTAIG